MVASFDFVHGALDDVSKTWMSQPMQELFTAGETLPLAYDPMDW